MCGIAGFVDRNGCTDFELNMHSVSRMKDTLRHRGPDNSGVWADRTSRVFLGHTRLAILELSKEGAQPMVSRSGRYSVTFNGEIYNHLELRRTCFQSSQWRGNSDTETLVEMIDKYGLNNTLSKITGMFAMAVWDMQDKKLSLARDRFGEKPLYYTTDVKKYGGFIFGSELSAIKAKLGQSPKIDLKALSSFMKLGFVSGVSSIYEGVGRVEPGSIVIYDLAGEDIKIEKYWNAVNAAVYARSNRFNGDYEEAKLKLENMLLSVVKGQMFADVPVGSFLSGGIDSSLVTALMQENSSTPVRTFSIGFEDPAWDEANYARKVADKLGTKHTEYYVNSDEVLAIIPKLAGIYSEPFSDASQIPTFIVSKLAREQITVSLTGDAGDEIFTGYGRYFFLEKMWRYSQKIPYRVRNLVSSLRHEIPLEGLNKLQKALARSNYNRSRLSTLMDRAHKGLNLLEANELSGIYDRLVGLWSNDV